MCAQVSWFTRSSRLPRPASPAPTTKVETVHPHVYLETLDIGELRGKRNSHYLVFNIFFRQLTR